MQVPLHQIDPAPDNPRKAIGDVSELAASIVEHGLLQPLVLAPGDDGRFLLVAGHRRLEACRAAGLATVEAVVGKRLDDARRLAAMLVENDQRVNLSPMERAEAYQRLIDEHDLNQTDVAKLVGKSPSYVNQTLQLLKPVDVRNAERERYRERRDRGVPQRGRPLAPATLAETMKAIEHAAATYEGGHLSKAQAEIALRVIEQGAWALQRERARDSRISGAAVAAVAAA